jgi:hypothetical protein
MYQHMLQFEWNVAARYGKFAGLARYITLRRLLRRAEKLRYNQLHAGPSRSPLDA